MSKLFHSGSIYNYINNLWERERERVRESERHEGREKEGRPVICSAVLIIASKCYCAAQNWGSSWRAFSGFSMSDGLLIWNTSWLRRLIFKPAVMLGGQRYWNMANVLQTITALSFQWENYHTTMSDNHSACCDCCEMLLFMHVT